MVGQAGGQGVSKKFGQPQFSQDIILYEGQFANQKLSGWGRKVYFQDKNFPQFHVGWFKDEEPHGFGIGNLNVTHNNNKVAEGWFYNGVYHPNGDVNYGQDVHLTRTFTIEEVGLKKFW